MTELVQECKSLFKNLLKIPDNFSIFFMSGGATSQFASIPLNLIDNPNSMASYVVNGAWSNLAFDECKRMAKVTLANPNQPKKDWNYAPKLQKSDIHPESKYVYYCDNETIHGVEYSQPPESFGIDLVTDMTSNFLTKPVDFTKFGIVYSGAQKNWGPAGLAIVIIRNDLLNKKGLPYKPKSMDYSYLAKTDSSEIPVPAFALVVARETIKWIMANGGLTRMNELSVQKSQILYDTIDQSNGFYVNSVKKDSRSRVNIICKLQGNDKVLTDLFVNEAQKHGLLQVAGHQSVGGLRFSVYNGMPLDGILRLQQFMKDFQANHQNKPKL
jgi:phosphoserine aminotransferase